MSNKKKQSKSESNLKISIDPEWEEWLHTTEKGQRTLLEASALFYQLCAEQQAETLPDGKEKRELLRMAEIFEHLRPSVQETDRFEHERLLRQWEMEIKTRNTKRQSLTKELNRMSSLPEPIFILDLPDVIIQKLIAARFDTVGKVLFGVQIATQQVDVLTIEEGWETALLHSRDFLTKAVGKEGYNLIGSRLIQYGYLQRSYFLSELNNEAEHERVVVKR